MTVDRGLKTPSRTMKTMYGTPTRPTEKYNTAQTITPKTDSGPSPRTSSSPVEFRFLGRPGTTVCNREALENYGPGYRLDRLGELDLPTLMKALEFGHYMELNCQSTSRKMTWNETITSYTRKIHLTSPTSTPTWTEHPCGKSSCIGHGGDIIS